jgi:hypothetical protein
MPIVASRTSEAFGVEPVQRAVERYAEHLRRQRGTQRMGPTGLLGSAAGPVVRQHTFYGQLPGRMQA